MRKINPLKLLGKIELRVGRESRSRFLRPAKVCSGYSSLGKSPAALIQNGGATRQSLDRRCGDAAYHPAAWPLHDLDRDTLIVRLVAAVTLPPEKRASKQSLPP